MRPAAIVRTTLVALMLVSESRAAARPAGAVDPLHPAAHALTRADSLIRSGAREGGFAILDSLDRAALAHGDARLRTALLVRRAGAQLGAFPPAAAESTVRRVLPELERGRDTLTLCRALLVLARVHGASGRRDAAQALYARTARLAAAARLPAEEGWARFGLGFGALSRDDAAAATRAFRAAAERLARGGEPAGAMLARLNLGRARQLALDQAGARAAYESARAAAVALGDRASEADAEYDLGSVEQSLGDASLAVPHYARANAIYRAIAWRPRVLLTHLALAIVEMTLDRLNDADTTLTAALGELRRSDDPDLRSRLLSETGALRRLQGRREESIAFGRRALALGDSVGPGARLMLANLLAVSLHEAGRDSEAAALADSQMRRPPPGAPPGWARPLQLTRATALRRIGRPGDALAGLRGALPVAGAGHGGQVGGTDVSWNIETARCLRALGRTDSATTAFATAAAGLAALRSGTTGAEWRENYEDDSTPFAAEYGALLLGTRSGGDEGARTRHAFEALQAFRARTLTERAGAGGKASYTLADLQHALRPGEVFCDLHAASDTSLMFVVTATSARAVGIAPAGRWRGALRRLRAILETPGAESEAARLSASSALGRTLFGAGAPELAGASRVLIAAGADAQQPLGLLALPGESGPLIERHEVACVPSAAFLVATRAARRHHAPLALLAVAHTHDEAGAVLAGARREVAGLADRYVGAESRVDGAIGPVARLLDDAARFDVLHFAAHTRNVPHDPWRQAMLLGDPDRAGSWLDAPAILAHRSAARLCVLSGCSSLGSRPGEGETLVGLASAWLAAGVPTVIATQWPVDDASTSELMLRFYAALARGVSAGAALREAQLALRAMPRWSGTSDWAGVVLYGDPETHVRLVARVATANGAARPVR